MLIINTQTKKPMEGRQVQVFVNDLLLDTVNINVIKKYKLDPGTYKVHIKIEYFQSQPKIIEITDKLEKFSFGISFQRKILFVTLFTLLGVIGDYFLRQNFGATAGNVYIVSFFLVLFYFNHRFTRYKTLRLVRVDN